MSRPTEDEIQVAHDTLHAIIDHEDEFGLEIADKSTIYGACAALGWLIGHPCGEGFLKLMQSVQETLAEFGYVLTKIEEQEESLDSKIDVWN